MSRGVSTLIVGLILVLVPGSATLAQVDLDDPIDDTVDTVEDTVEDTVKGKGKKEKGKGDDKGQDTTDEVEEVDDVDDAIDEAGETAGEVVGGASDAVGSAGGGTGDDGQSSEATPLPSNGVAAGAGSAKGDQKQGSDANRGQRASRAAGRNAVATRAGSPLGSPSEGRDVEVTLASAEGLVYVPLVVQLTNDANGDGTYSDRERAREANGGVPLQVVLRNAGGRTLEVLAVREVSTTDSQTQSVCNLTGRQLEPGQATQCRFASSAIVRPGQMVVRVVEIDVVALDDPGTSTTVTDTSVVEGPSTLGLVVRRALAGTGAMIGLLLLIAAGLAATGGISSWLGSRRSRVAREVRADPTGARPVGKKADQSKTTNARLPPDPGRSRGP
jgi:hypothetical protein